MNIINIGLQPVGPGPWEPKVKSKLGQQVKSEYCSIASQEFRFV